MAKNVSRPAEGGKKAFDAGNVQRRTEFSSYKDFVIPDKKLEKFLRDYFISDCNYERASELFGGIVKEGMDFKLARSGNESVVTYRDQESIMRDLLEPAPRDATGIEGVLGEAKRKVISGSVNFSSPGFISFPDCGNSIAGMSGHILSGFLNQNLINSVHTSPTATFVEIAVINWLREMVGFETNLQPKTILDVGGINVPGGVLANTVGLLLARENRFPGTLKKGIEFDPSRVKIFIPNGISHYSARAGLGWIGFGTNSMVDVKTHDFRIDQEDLVKKLEHHRSNGDMPLALVAYCGDSRTMTVDDFEGLARIAKKYGIWFHIDACHGLSLCFSERFRDKVRAMSLADSITVDPHKILFVPYSLSYVLVRDPSKFDLIAGVSDLITKEEFSFGQITPFLGSRAFNSLKLWMLMKHMGTNNIGKLVEHRHGMALYFASRLAKEPDFYVMNDVNVNNVVYLYVPAKLRRMLGSQETGRAIETINKLNANIHRRIFEEGKFYIHTFKLNDFSNVFGLGPDAVFQMQRVSIGNPQTTKRVLREFIAYLRTVCKEEHERLIRAENSKM